jgi:hypothetical protein
MLTQGGLLTEYMTHTRADKMNFVRRNRIVAGMADGIILVESAAKGGGLITMRIAQSYDRQTFAFPGNVGAAFSEGCNNLIRDNGAALIASAQDFVEAMGWQDDNSRQTARQQGVERQLFPDLTADEQAYVQAVVGRQGVRLQRTLGRNHIVLGMAAVLPVAGLHLRKTVAPDDALDVQAGATAQDGHLAPRNNVGVGRREVLLKLIHAVARAGLGYVYQVVNHLLPVDQVVGEVLPRAYIHVAEHLPAVGADDFAVEPACQKCGKPCLATRRRA